VLRIGTGELGNIIPHTSSPCVPLLQKEREEREKEIEKIIVPILTPAQPGEESAE
jgi:hypothetical protein